MVSSQVLSKAVLFYALFLVVANGVELPSDGARPTKSWVEKRDQGIVKQTFDASCGATSLANILNNYYGLKTNELDVLAAMRLDRPRLYSLKDIGNAVNALGFKPIYFASDYDTLTKLKIPVIIYIESIDGGHFSVLRDIDDSYVWLNDPAWGNVRKTKAQFLKLWLSNNGLGKGLGVVREEADDNVDPNYFGSIPDDVVNYYGAEVGGD